MRNKFASAPALLFFLWLLLGVQTSAVDLSTLPEEFYIQGSGSGREFPSKPHEKELGAAEFKLPNEFIRSGSNTQLGRGHYEDNAGDSAEIKPCNISDEKLQRMKSVDGSTWLIDNNALDILDNDPQELIQCTSPGDRVIHKLSGVQKFQQTLTVFHELELRSESPDATETGAFFTCPDTAPFLIVNATRVTVHGFNIENCSDVSGNSTLVVNPRSSVVFADISISNNRNRAISALPESVVTVKNSVFNNDGTSQLAGGVISVVSRVSLNISKSTFSRNEAYLGGVLYVQDNSTIVLRDSFFFENNAVQGAVIFLNSNNTLSLEDSTISKNNASINAALFLLSNNVIAMENSTLSQNNASVGGAVCVYLNNNVTIDNSTMSQNSAYLAGAAVFLDINNVLTMKNSVLSDNNASWGGAVFVNSTNAASIVNCELSRNDATINGGAMFFSEKNTVTMNSSTLSNNTAWFFGGAVGFDKTNAVTASNCTFTSNKAFHIGGSVYVASHSSLTVLNCVVSSNEAAHDGGGFYFVFNNTADVHNSTFSRNVAFMGAALFMAREVTATILDSTFTHNNASQRGTIYAGSESDISIERCDISGNEAVHGGFLYGSHMSLSVSNSSCFNNLAHKSGGCFHLASSSAKLEKSKVSINKALEDGGAIYMTMSSSMKLDDCSVRSNHANRAGGGIGVVFNSRITCAQSTLEDNTALFGGGLYNEARVSQGIVVQIIDSTVRNNKALDYGGGMVSKIFGSRNANYSNVYVKSARVLLTKTTFIDNIAKQYGAALMVTKLDAILISCNNTCVYLGESYISEVEMRVLVEQNDLKKLGMTRACSSWQGNYLQGNTFKNAVGAFGQKINITIESTDGTHITSDNKSGLVLHNISSGKPVPKITVSVINVFNEVTVPLFERDAMVLSSLDGFLDRPITFSFTNITCVIEGIVSFVRPGNYTIKFKPKSDDVLREMEMTIIVRECVNDEERALEGKVCQPCGEAHYNFSPSKGGNCATCPKGADCTKHYIIPIEGYWHKSPCHDKMKKCIADKACNYANRNKILANFVQDIISCDMNETRLEEYDKAQCHKGYKGPLCGSCKESYGVSANSECSKCGQAIIVVLRFLGAVVYLLAGTIITIKGVLPSSSSQQTCEDVETPLLEPSSSTPIDVGGSSQVRADVENESQDPSQPLIEGDENSQNSGSHEVDEIEVTKQKLVSSLKISLNYFQVTSTAAGMDVEWTTKILDMLEGLNVLGAATTESISYSFDCVFSSASNDSKAILRLLCSLIVPIIVVLLLSLHWGYKSMTKHDGDWLYFLRRLTLSVITVTYATYFDLTQVAMRTFSCVAVHANVDHFSNAIRRYWTGDTSMECYKNAHIVLICISLVIVTMVTIGFPMFSSITLNQHKTEVRDINSWTHDTLGFLGGPFKQRFIYWECVTMIKKAILSIIIVFSYSLEVQAQGLLILLVLVFFLYIHYTTYPYDNEYFSLNYYESGSLLVSCVTYTLIQFFNVEQFSEVARSIISLSIIAVNVWFVCVMAYKIIKDLVHLLRCLLKSQNIYIPKNMNVFSLIKVYYSKIRSRQEAE